MANKHVSMGIRLILFEKTHFDGILGQAMGFPIFQRRGTGDEDGDDDMPTRHLEPASILKILE